MNISVFAIAMALWAVVLHVDASPVRARKWADQRHRRERAPAVGGRVIAARIRGPPRSDHRGQHTSASIRDRS